MIESLAFATTLGCAVLALACLFGAARYRFARVLPYLVVVELALVVQTVAIVLDGHRPKHSGEHWAYVVTALLWLPVFAPLARRPRWWSAVLLGLALVLLAVVVIRMQTVWRS
ncbi:hypothetical protein D5S17_29535 [Pseudonocardiaceae bacterium YIM PH 21723]|nr:hypothetical protein D5S17_29535 [Pseudonocardiaceae bacterium YIM PH 21723]